MIRFVFAEFMCYIASIFIYKYNEDYENTYIAVQVMFMAAYGAGF